MGWVEQRAEEVEGKNGGGGGARAVDGGVGSGALSYRFTYLS